MLSYQGLEDGTPLNAYVLLELFRKYCMARASRKGIIYLEVQHNVRRSIIRVRVGVCGLLRHRMVMDGTLKQHEKAHK